MSRPHRLLLRAELDRGGEVVEATACELDGDLVAVEVARPASEGETLEVRLSLPGLLAPLRAPGQVVAARLPAGPGKPGRWTIRLTLDDDQRARLVAAATGGAAGAPFRVLLVDDSELTCDAFGHGIQRFFAARGQTVAVDSVGASAAAWQRLGASRYDVVIVDYYLPGENGTDLIGRIRGDAALAGLTVLAVSAGGELARADSVSAGADLFLDKPLVLRDLCETLERLVAARQPA